MCVWGVYLSLSPFHTHTGNTRHISKPDKHKGASVCIFTLYSYSSVTAARFTLLSSSAQEEARRSFPAARVVETNDLHIHSGLYDRVTAESNLTLSAGLH